MSCKIIFLSLVFTVSIVTAFFMDRLGLRQITVNDFNNNSEKFSAKKIGVEKIAGVSTDERSSRAVFHRIEQGVLDAWVLWDHEPLVSLQILSDLGLTSKMLLFVMEEFSEKLDVSACSDTLRNLHALEGGFVGDEIIGVFARKAIADNQSETLVWLDKNRPTALRLIAKECWLRDEDSTVKFWKEMSDESSKSFLLGTTGNSLNVSSENFSLIVDKIRNSKEIDGRTQAIMEASFLARNLKGREDVILKMVENSNYELVRDRLLPELAILKNDGNWSKAYEWLTSYEGRDDTLAVKALLEQWHSASKDTTQNN